MFHNSKAAVALSGEPQQHGVPEDPGLNDFYFGTKGYEWPMGNIQMVGKSKAEAMKGEKPKLTKLAPHWSLSDVAEHAVDFWLTTEDLPVPDNRVTVDDSGDVHLAYRSTKRRGGRSALPRDEEDPEPRRVAGASRPREELLHGHVDLRGGSRAPGRDLPVRDGSATSVLDVNCKAHELDNLYVVDTSFFPSIGAVNPALTAMANSIRVGEHLLDRLG